MFSFDSAAIKWLSDYCKIYANFCHIWIFLSLFKINVSTWDKIYIASNFCSSKFSGSQIESTGNTDRQRHAHTYKYIFAIKLCYLVNIQEAHEIAVSELS